MKKSSCFYLLFFLLHSTAFTQQKRVDNLVFEGAGIRGLAFCGAIKVLEEEQLLPNVKRIAGTSAGAITALLLSLNYSAVEITQIIGSTNFKKFNDGGFPLLGGSRRLLKQYGWFKGKKFERWLEQLIKAKTGNANITFSELAKKYTPIYITGTSLNQQLGIVFSAENFPAMPVKDAVRISMSIPLYYKAILMRNDGTLITKPRQNEYYHVMVDGGFMNNFPIQLFDSSKYINDTSKNTFAVNPYTIGFRVDSKQQKVLDSNIYNKTLAPIPIKNIGTYFNAFIVLITERMNRQSLTPADWQRTVSIEDGGISPQIKAMPQNSIDTLVQNGAAATKIYLLK